jgi:hypothetical protein
MPSPLSPLHVGPGRQFLLPLELRNRRRYFAAGTWGAIPRTALGLLPQRNATSSPRALESLAASTTPATAGFRGQPYRLLRIPGHISWTHDLLSFCPSMALGTQCPCSSSWRPGGASPHGRASNLPCELPQTQVQGAPASSMVARARPSPSMELGVAPFAARCSSSPFSPPLHRSAIRPMPHRCVWMSRRPPIRGSWRRIWGDFSPVMKLRRGPQILRGRASARRFHR